jgi:hypothetical protein
MKGTLRATTRPDGILPGHTKYRRLRAGCPAPAGQPTVQNSPLKG